MKKHKKRSPERNNSKVLIPVAAVLVVLAVALVCMIGFILKDGPTVNQPGEITTPTTAQTDAPTVPTQPPETTLPKDQLPYLLENGKLEIESIFQYTGLNPDSGWEEGRNIGAIVLHNRSDEYLDSLELTITMSDGAQLQYKIYDIPAGKTVWAYDVNNVSYDDTALIDQVECAAVFRQDSGLTSDQVTVSVNTMEVTLTNVSGADLSNLEIHCHNMVDGVYFGGTVYVYPVETLISGGSVTVMAMDCFLGEAAVTIVDLTQ